MPLAIWSQDQSTPAQVSTTGLSAKQHEFWQVAGPHHYWGAVGHSETFPHHQSVSSCRKWAEIPQVELRDLALVISLGNSVWKAAVRDYK